MSETKAVLIIGAGGHGKVVADCLLSSAKDDQELKPIGYLDDDEHLVDQNVLGLPVLGVIDKVSSVAHDGLVVAIGNNDLRRRLFDAFVAGGETLVTSIHASATVAPDVSVGTGAMICAGVIVNPGSHIGDNVILNTGCIVEHDCRIDDHAHIAPGVTLGGDVHIGPATLVGLGATILRGVTIGKDCVIGAGAVVTKNIGDTSVVAGIPARDFGH